MASKALANAIDRLRSLATVQQAGQLPDGELLARFVAQHDETAFTALVERHAGMVLQVCRRVLHHQQDAEDACQATFLVLVRKAAAIRKLNSLSSWLHGVALRISLKSRGQLARLRRSVDEMKQAQIDRADKENRFTCDELGAIVDEELERLPEKYRAPLILCCLQSRTRDEAARMLGLEESTLKGRLEWGRKLLRQRLARRGVALSTAMLVVGLGQSVSATPAALVVAVAKSAVAAPSSAVAALVQVFMRGLLLKQIQAGAAATMLTLCIAGAGWFTYQVLDQESEPAKLAAVAVPLPRGQDPQPKDSPPVADSPVPEMKQEEPPPEKPAEKSKELTLLQRGEQLAMKCAECHTPRDAKGELDLSRHLQGAHLRSVPNKRERESEDDTPDITSNGRAGKWSEEKMIAFLSRGQRSEGPAAAHRLSRDDAQAVSAYLRTLTGKKKATGRRGE